MSIRQRGSVRATLPGARGRPRIRNPTYIFVYSIPQRIATFTLQDFEGIFAPDVELCHVSPESGIGLSSQPGQQREQGFDISQ